MGHDADPKNTEHQDQFTQKNIPLQDKNASKALKADLTRSHIKVGIDPNLYDTTYRAEHDDKGVLPKDETVENVKKDLRVNHYELGYQKVIFSFLFLE